MVRNDNRAGPLKWLIAQIKSELALLSDPTMRLTASIPKSIDELNDALRRYCSILRFREAML
jgi:hypothetical protein